MKKILSYLIFLIPTIVLSSNPPPPALPNNVPVSAPIDSMIFVLFAAGVVFGGYVVLKRNKIQFSKVKKQ